MSLSSSLAARSTSIRTSVAKLSNQQWGTAVQIRRMALSMLLVGSAACQDAGGVRSGGPSARVNRPNLVGGGLVISTPLTLDKTNVVAGDTLRGTVTYQNISSSPISVQAVTIGGRPPGGTNGAGPYYDLTPTLAAQTVPPGATATLAASRAFTAGDPTGSWYAFATYQDAGGAWHDGPSVNFTVASLAATPSITPGTSSSSSPVNATIACPSTGTLPYRTTDGSAPTTSATQSGTATFSSSGTLKAICAGGGYAPSAIASATYTITIAAGGLVISTPLTLDKTNVVAGDTLRGTVTYQNTSASPISVQAVTIGGRPPGGTKGPGPYYDLTPTLAAQTVQPGATVTLEVGRASCREGGSGPVDAVATDEDGGGDGRE